MLSPCLAWEAMMRHSVQYVQLREDGLPDTVTPGGALLKVDASLDPETAFMQIPDSLPTSPVTFQL